MIADEQSYSDNVCALINGVSEEGVKDKDFGKIYICANSQWAEFKSVNDAWII